MTHEEHVREALVDVVHAFASRGPGRTLSTGGNGALEGAFQALGWADPHPYPEGPWCDEPGCDEVPTCGTPTPGGYRSTCGEHVPEDRR